MDGPASAAMDADTGQLAWTPALAAETQVAFEVRAYDARGGYARQQWLVDVSGVNTPPVLPAIADRLAGRAAGERNAAIAEVRSAVELDDETVARLSDSLSKATGKQVEVKTVVDPTVLGGIVARVGDTVFDGSLRHRLEELRDKLTHG